MTTFTESAALVVTAIHEDEPREGGCRCYSCTIERLVADVTRLKAEREQLNDAAADFLDATAETHLELNRRVAELAAQNQKYRDDFVLDRAELASMRNEVASLRHQREELHARAQRAELALETTQRTVRELEAGNAKLYHQNTDLMAEVDDLREEVASGEKATTEQQDRAMRAENALARVTEERDAARAAVQPACDVAVEQATLALESHVEALQGEADRLREMLVWLNRKGGLGLDVHARIEAALANTSEPAPQCSNPGECCGPYDSPCPRAKPSEPAPCASCARLREDFDSERLRAVAAEASLAGALDVIEHAYENVRGITGGDERRMRAFLEKHERLAAASEEPRCPTCRAALGDHHSEFCSAGRGQVLPSEIPGYVESVARGVLGRKPR